MFNMLINFCPLIESNVSVCSSAKITIVFLTITIAMQLFDAHHQKDDMESIFI